MLNYGPAVLILFSIFVGILLSRRDFTMLKADMERRFDQMDKKFDVLTARVSALESDYTQFYGMQQKMEGRLDEVSARVK